MGTQAVLGPGRRQVNVTMEGQCVCVSVCVCVRTHLCVCSHADEGWSFPIQWACGPVQMLVTPKDCVLQSSQIQPL